MSETTQSTVNKPLGLIDVLTIGFRVVQRRPWLILLPLVLDLGLWLGPHVSVGSLIDGVLALWPTGQFPADMAPMAEAYRQALAATGEQFNLLWLLSNGLTWLNLLVPALGEPARMGVAGEPAAVSLMLWAPLLLALGTGLGSVFLTSVASQLPSVGDNPPEAPGASFWVRRGLRMWGLILIYGLLLLAVLLVSLLLLSLALTAVLLVVPALGVPLSALGVLLFAWAALWIYLLLYFVVAALAVDGVGLRQALWRSTNVVIRNFWATLGLALLSYLILLGFGLIWQRLAQAGAWGVPIAIAGNALLVAGLSAARLVFYRERRSLWQAALVSQKGAISRWPRP